MEKQIDIKKRIASLTSNVLNPFLICLALIILFSFISSASAPEAMKWAGISMAVSLLPVFLFIIYRMRKGKLDNFFIRVRQQRTIIYLIGFVCASISCILLTRLEAPIMLIAAFATGISTLLLFSLINLRWKISIHTAIVAASATILVLLYGWMAAASVALVPLTGWARIELEYHSLAQVVSGAILATLLVMVMFYPLALA